MSDLIRDGLTWLTSQLKNYASQTVTYVATGGHATVKATFGATLLKLTDDFGNERVVWTDRDFLIHAADLVIGVDTVLPVRGDTITYVDSVGTTYTYEVTAPGKEPEWKWEDPFRLTLRIHSKLIKTVGA